MLGKAAAAIGVAAATLLLGAPPALAAPGYAGTTSQGNEIAIRLDAGGIVERVAYGWDMSCRGGGSLTNGGTVSRPGSANATSFSSRGGYEAPIERRFAGAFKVKLNGRRASDTRYRGTFKVRAKVFRKRTGEVLTRCSTGNVGWTADLKGATPAPVPRPGSGRFSTR
jgi:hypothetical protein